jgi:YesN/AraC family two-component response regulator
LIYRRKSYKVHPSILEKFNEHFNQNLLPAQLKYGARLVGRWMVEETTDTAEVFAIWEYDSIEHFEEIEEKIKNDIEHVERVQNWFKEMGGRENLKKVFYAIEQDFPKETVLKVKTIMK